MYNDGTYISFLLFMLVLVVVMLSQPILGGLFFLRCRDCDGFVVCIRFHLLMTSLQKRWCNPQVHFIFQHENPVTKKWEEKHFKKTPKVRSMQDTRTLVLTAHRAKNIRSLRFCWWQRGAMETCRCLVFFFFCPTLRWMNNDQA